MVCAGCLSITGRAISNRHLKIAVLKSNSLIIRVIRAVYDAFCSINGSYSGGIRKVDIAPNIRISSPRAWAAIRSFRHEWGQHDARNRFRHQLVFPKFTSSSAIVITSCSLGREIKNASPVGKLSKSIRNRRGVKGSMRKVD